MPIDADIQAIVADFQKQMDPLESASELKVLTTAARALGIASAT